MNLREFIEGLQDYANENPECLEMAVITCDENGYFARIEFEPTQGVYDDDGEFTDVGELEDAGLTESDINAVCVN